MATISTSPPLAEELLPHDERARVLSSARLKLRLSIFLTVLLLTIFGLTRTLVRQLFEDSLRAARANLVHTARHGALELARTAELGVVVGAARWCSIPSAISGRTKTSSASSRSAPTATSSRGTGR